MVMHKGPTWGRITYQNTNNINMPQSYKKEYRCFNGLYWYVPIKNNRSHGLGQFYHKKNHVRDEIIQYKSGEGNHGVRVGFKY